MSILGTIVMTTELVSEIEKLKGYWDETGLDMHIAVKKNGYVAVSTKHWSRTHYIITEGLETDDIWLIIEEISKDIGRSLIKSDKGPYVYINKLNVKQTQEIFNKFKEKLGDNIDRRIEWSWKIDDAVLPSLIIDC